MNRDWNFLSSLPIFSQFSALDLRRECSNTSLRRRDCFCFSHIAFYQRHSEISTSLHLVSESDRMHSSFPLRRVGNARFAVHCILADNPFLLVGGDYSYRKSP